MGQTYRSLFMTVVSIGGLLLLWQGAVTAGLLPVFYLSSPAIALETAMELAGKGEITRHFLASAWSFLIAFAVAAASGILMGLLAGWYRIFERALDPFVWFFYTTPAIAFYPLFIAWFGFGRPTAVAVAIVFAFTPIYANTITGIKNTSPDLLKMARSFGANRLDLFIRVALPASLPLIMSGLQLGVGRVLAGIVIAELFGSNAGLGYAINYYAQYMQTAPMMVFVLIVIACGLAVNQIMLSISKYMSKGRA